MCRNKMAAYQEKVKLEREEEALSAELVKLRKTMSSCEQEATSIVNDITQTRLRNEHRRLTSAAHFLSSKAVVHGNCLSCRQMGSESFLPLLQKAPNISLNCYL